MIRKCLNCGYSQAEVYENKNDYEKVTVCPKCNGESIYVDELIMERRSREYVLDN